MKILVIICCVLSTTYYSACSDACGKHNENDKQFPWNVGIYKETEPGKLIAVCMGSIIKPNFVVTAAHCLCDRLNGQRLDSQFYVVSGKITKTLLLKDKNKSLLIEKVLKKNIEVYHQYSGLLSFFENDIAILKLENSFNFNDQISPICVDWGTNDPSIQQDAIGKQVIWSESGTKIIDTSHLDHLQCEVECQKLMWQSFLTNDKICSNSKGVILNENDGGSGLVFKHPEKNMWYLRAVYSLQDNLAHKINVYTRLARFINWLTSKTINLS